MLFVRTCGGAKKGGEVWEQRQDLANNPVLKEKSGNTFVGGSLVEEGRRAQGE